MRGLGYLALAIAVCGPGGAAADPGVLIPMAAISAPVFRPRPPHPESG